MIVNNPGVMLAMMIWLITIGIGSFFTIRQVTSKSEFPIILEDCVLVALVVFSFNALTGGVTSRFPLVYLFLGASILLNIAIAAPRILTFVRRRRAYLLNRRIDKLRNDLNQ